VPLVGAYTPTVAITNPTVNDVVTSDAPTFTWTYQDALGKPQAFYRVVLVYTQVGTTYQDTGYVAGSATSFTPSSYVLTDFSQFTLTVYVKNSNGLIGSASVTFTTSLSDPVLGVTPLSTVGEIYDVAINGVGMMLAPNDESGQKQWDYKRIIKPLEPYRFATGETPFAQQIDHYHFTSWTDFSGGTGQKWFERNNSIPNAFYDSLGVDPFSTPYQLQLLTTSATSNGVATTQNPCLGTNVNGTAYVQTGAKQLTYITAPGGAGTAFSIASAGTVIDLDTDGQNWYAVDSVNGIFRGTTADPGAAWIKAGSGMPASTNPFNVSYAAQRVCVGYSSTSGGTTPNVWSTFTQAGAEEVVGGRLILPVGWTVTKSTSGSGQIYFGAYYGSRGTIYRWQPGSTTSSGGQVAPASAWDLPIGETPTAVFWYEGALYIAAARPVPSGGVQGVLYKGLPDANGNLSASLVAELGTPTTTVDNSIRAFGARGNKLFFSWYAMDGTNSGIGCLYLPTGGYCKWHVGTAGAKVRSVFSFQGRMSFTLDGVGLFVEGTTYQTTGWLKTSLSDQNAVVGKVWDNVYVVVAPLNTSESVSVDYTLDKGNTFTNLSADTLNVVGEVYGGTSLNKKADTIGFRVTLNGPGSTSPTLYRLTAEVHQFGIADRLIQVPIDCFDTVTDLRGKPLEENGPGAGMKRLRSLEALAYTRVLFQDLDYQDTATTYIMEVVQVETDFRSLYSRRRSEAETGGVAVLTLKQLAKS